MGTNVVTAFFVSRADAALALERLTTFGVDADEVSVMHREPPSVRELGIRHPAESEVPPSGDSIGSRLARSGTLVMADVGFAMAGPLVEALAEGRNAPGVAPGSSRGLIVAALTRLGVPEYEATYLEEAVQRGGTVLIVPLGRDGADLSQFLAQAGGRKIHDAHEQPPVMRA